MISANRRKVPSSTYRLQFHKGFTFTDGASVADYLAVLNVSHLYASPVMESVAGSVHGYDVIDFAKVSEERGGLAALKSLDERLRDFGLGMVLDIVPNHMGGATNNPYWRDVLAKGRASQYWTLFDMRVPDGEKIHLPVLGEDMRKLFDDGNLRIENGALAYFNDRYPLSPETKISGNPDWESFIAILAEQNYELKPWTDIFQHVSYRRFFDIASLIGVRVEDEKNYVLIHKYLFDLLPDLPSVTGLRTDHIDGLADPLTYLRRLSAHNYPIWVEKILSGTEELREEWPIAGTTGYEFIAWMNKIFVHPHGFSALKNYWLKNIESQWPDFAACVAETKSEQLHALFPTEARRLAMHSADDADGQARALEFWSALAENISVYRTYAGQGPADKSDRALIESAAKDAPNAAEFLPALLNPQTPRQAQAVVEWQQLSGPLMAKGLEDCAHYRYTPLAALNEVGCHGDLDGGDAKFFDWMTTLATHWPECLKATSTHDTKRSEDARHRLYALADMPDEWFAFLNGLADLTKSMAQRPSEAAEYLLYQSLLATWPNDGAIDDGYRTRVAAYMQKAIKEARRETSWLKTNEVYEKNVAEFIDGILRDNAIVNHIRSFAAKIALAGAVNSLAVQTLKILSPGVPDFYEGTETWDYSLVDPDNRRPVDFAAHRTILAEIDALEKTQGRAALLRRLTDQWQDGAIKIWLTRELLKHRVTFSHIRPVPVSGARKDHVIAYELDGEDNSHWLVILPRYMGRFMQQDFRDLSKGWDGNQINNMFDGAHNLLTGEAFNPNATSWFREFPVAVFCKH